MKRARYPSQRGPRWSVVLVVVLLHVALVIALVRAFAPEFSARVSDQVFGSVTVTVTTTPPSSPVSAPVSQSTAPLSAGASAETGKRATARPIAAPSPAIAIATQPAAPVAGQGDDNAAGARDTGIGTGAGGQGSGTGAGLAGNGQGGGGGVAAKAVKLAGDINSARDYPKDTREQRLGDYVIVALTVGADGRVKGCRIHRASRDSQADQITCRLATERFRFRPATDATGRAIESVFGWQQRWFGPAEKNQTRLEPAPVSGI